MVKISPFLEFLRMFKRILEQEREIYCSKNQLELFKKKKGVLYKNIKPNF